MIEQSNRQSDDEDEPGTEDELRRRGLQVLREEALTRRGGPNRAAVVSEAVAIVARLAPRERNVSTTDGQGRPLRLTLDERRTLWTARAVLAGQDERPAGRHWDTHGAELAAFFAEPPFTRRVGSFDIDITALLEEQSDRREAVRSAYRVLAELAVPDLTDDEHDRLLTDVVATRAWPADGRRCSTGITDLQLGSALAQARLSGVPAAVVDSYRDARYFDFQDRRTYERLAALTEELARRVRAALRKEELGRREQDSLGYAEDYLADALGMRDRALRLVMNGVRVGAFPPADLWKSVQLSRYETFKGGLGNALAEHRRHQPFPDHDAWEDAVLSPSPTLVEDEVLGHTALSAATVGIAEAARRTFELVRTGPAALRHYYAVGNDPDREDQRCRCAVEAARFWLRTRAGSRRDVVDQLRDAVITVAPAWTGSRRRRELPFVAWTAKELLDAVIGQVDGVDAAQLVEVRLRVRLAVLHALPPAVVSMTDRDRKGRLAARVAVPADAVLDEIEELLADGLTVRADDPDLGLAALHELEKTLSDAYGELPRAAHRLSTRVTARLHPDPEPQS